MSSLIHSGHGIKINAAANKRDAYIRKMTSIIVVL